MHGRRSGGAGARRGYGGPLNLSVIRASCRDARQAVSELMINAGQAACVSGPRISQI
jgi:hypothetical protein